MRTVTVFLSFILAAGAASATSAPLSDIPWLSESVNVPPSPAARPSIVRQHAISGAEEIVTTPLGAVSKEAAGVLPSVVTGLSRDMWGESDPETLRALVGGLAGSGVPEAQALLRRVLLAQAEPPRADTGGESLLMARIDRLLVIGALNEAKALIDVVQPDTPELFRRWFDIGLLSNDVAPPCEALRRNPTLSPTLPARVFCLARGGDWNAAEITLTLGSEVGSIDDEQHALLARFLDPEVFEGEPEPGLPEPLTPIDFLMREAIGLPRPSVTLPLPFLHHDLSEHAPMRMRVDAAERLAVAGSISQDVLKAAYLTEKPAASGGLWSRAEAIQAFEDALVGGMPDEIATALKRADDAMADRGLRTQFARFVSPRLAEIDAQRLGAQERLRVFELLMLSDELSAAEDAVPQDDEAASFLLAVARGTETVPAALEALPLAAAVQTGLLPREGSDIRERNFAAAMERGNQGEVLLRALELLDAGAEIDPQSLQAALHALTLAGQGEAARRIAIQTLLARPSDANS